MTLRTLNYGNYGIFLKMGNAGFCPSAVAYGRRGVQVKGALRVYIIAVTAVWSSSPIANL